MLVTRSSSGRAVWLLDGVEAEAELRRRDLLGRVLVPALEPGESGDPHDEQAVALLEGDDRGLLRDRHVDAEPLPRSTPSSGLGGDPELCRRHLVDETDPVERP